MDESTTKVLSQGPLLCRVARFLTRRWAHALVQAVQLDGSATRQSVVSAAWDACLLALAQEGNQSAVQLYQLCLDENCGWTKQTDDVPGNVEVLAGEGHVVYALGGATAAWQIDLRSGAWNALPNRPPQHGPEALVASGHLIVSGGYDDQLPPGSLQAAHGIVTGKVSAYSRETDTWSILMPMPTSRASHFACAADRRHVYVAGGIGDLGVLSSADVLDLRYRVWFTVPQMSVPRFNCSGAIQSGGFAVFGGQFENSCEVLSAEVNESDSSSPSSASYHPHAWTRLPELPFKDMWIKAASVEERCFLLGRTAACMLDHTAIKWRGFQHISNCRVIALCAGLVPNDIEDI